MTPPATIVTTICMTRRRRLDLRGDVVRALLVLIVIV